MKEIRIRLTVDDKEIDTVIENDEEFCKMIVPALSHEQTITLLEMGVDADRISKHLLRKQKTAEMLYSLISYGMSIWSCNLWDNEEGDINIRTIIELLCKNGHDINKVVGNLWFHWEDELCNELDFLLKKGADLGKIMWHMKPKTVRTKFDWFLEHGVNVDVALENSGCSPEFYIERGGKEFVKELLNMGASAKNVVKSGCFWRSQDTIERAEILELMFERGASVADILCGRAEEAIASEEDFFMNLSGSERFLMIAHPDIFSRHGLDYGKFEFELKKRYTGDNLKKSWYLKEYANLGTKRIFYLNGLFGCEIAVNLTNLERCGLKINRKKFFKYVTQRYGESFLRKNLDSENYSYLMR